MLIRLEQLSKYVGGRALFERASLQLQAGDCIGLVGPNGAGKSTLLRIIHGSESCDGGRVLVPGDARIGILRQEIDPTLPHSVRREAASALAELHTLEAEMRDLETRMVEAGRNDKGVVPPYLAERYDRVSARFAQGGGFEREARVSRALAGLGFDDDACERPLSSFSGGWLMRVELAKLLLSNPDVLLLDEPTNHLDLPAIQWFEDTLEDFRGAVILVSHDRTLLRRHVRRVAELDGRGGFSVYEGGYDSYLEQREQRRSELLARKANQDREIARMERFVERYRAKAAKQARQAQSRLKALERIERIEVEPQPKKPMRLRIPAPPRAGDVVVRLEGVHKSYGSKKVYEGIDLCVRRGERVALAGKNGAGKSTLLRIVAGQTTIDQGERTPGHNVRVGFFAQHQLEALNPEQTVLEELARVAHTDDVPRLRGHLGAFLFSGEEVEKRVDVLSGGEKARLALAKMLLRPRNLLVLDEPTSHLDIQAREVLEQALREFTGTLVFVSHDRSFINALATRVVEVRAGELREYLGNYDDYLHNKQKAESERATNRGVTPAAQAPQPVPPGATPDAKLQRQRQRERRKARDRTAKRIARIEDEIHEREQEIEALGYRLADPEVYSSPERLAELNARKEELQRAVDARYRTWEDLTEELEDLEQERD